MHPIFPSLSAPLAQIQTIYIKGGDQNRRYGCGKDVSLKLDASLQYSTRATSRPSPTLRPCGSSWRWRRPGRSGSPTMCPPPWCSRPSSTWNASTPSRTRTPRAPCGSELYSIRILQCKRALLRLHLLHTKPQVPLCVLTGARLLEVWLKTFIL